MTLDDDDILGIVFIAVWLYLTAKILNDFGAGWGILALFTPLVLWPMAKAILKDFWRDAKKLLKREGDGSEIWVPIVAICGAGLVYLAFN